jgi:hypothetical protein
MGVAVPDARAAVLQRLVRACAARDRPGADDLPIVVLWGSRGSECSELLKHLEEIDDWSGPRAFLDGETLAADLRPYEIANRLAFQLGRRTARFGRARFPRFFLGMWAAGGPLDPDSTAGARAARHALIRRKLQNRSEGRRWVRETAVALAGLAGMDTPVTGAVGLAVDGLMEASRTIGLLRGAGMRWYRDGLGRRWPDPVDALVELSVREFQDDHEWVDEVLCRAFVADLRHEFDAGVTLFGRGTSAVALLDNVGTPALSRFLGVLSEQRDGSGPLLVVAASHQRYPPVAATEHARWQPDALEEASLARWSDQRADRGGSRFYPVWVDPVDEVAPTGGPIRPEVRVIADRLGLGPPMFPTVAFAHRLTAAHPAGLDAVFDALRGPDCELTPGRIDLRGTLGLVDPASGRPLDDRVFDLVLGPWTPAMRRGLVLMAIAVDLSDAKLAPILREETQRGRQLITEFRARDLWVTHQLRDGVPRPPRLHPFARRAIAHRLARPGGIEPVDLRWDRAHELLRDASAASRDDMAALYHALALGRVRQVAARLTEMFDPVHPRDWYELLLRVTAAPVPRPDRAESTPAHFGELCAEEGPEPLVSRRLVAALWLHSDPLGDPRHDMCGIVGSELNELAGHAAEGAPFLIEQSKTFHRCWDRWHPHGGSSE